MTNSAFKMIRDSRTLDHVYIQSMIRFLDYIQGRWKHGNIGPTNEERTRPHHEVGLESGIPLESIPKTML